METQPVQPRLFEAPIDIASVPPAERMNCLAESLEALNARGEFNGSVVIAENGIIKFERHLGTEDIDGTVPLSRHSSFSLASVSKSFTALGIMILARRRRLGLDDLLAEHVPELAHYQGVTIRHLLHHTSGIPDHTELAEELWNPAFILPIHELLAMIEKYRPRRYFAPGDEFEYSNTGYVLLGEIIARRSGQSYPDFMAAEVFQPLGMADSAAFNLSSKVCTLRCRAFGYRRHEGRRLRRDLNFLDGVFGDGGIYASAADLVLWDRALREGTLIPVEEYREAYVPGRLNNGNTTGYGFGWDIRSDDVVDHWGEWEGFSAYVRRDLKKATLLVVLSNQGPPSDVDPICGELTDFVASI